MSFSGAFGWKAVRVASLVTAAWFFFDHLGLRAFWLDEASSANLVSLSWSRLPAQAVLEGCPVLYALLLKAWSLAFGDGEFALRSFSACCALGVVWMLGRAAREAFGEEAAAALATALGATNYFLIFFATQNRVYTLAALAGLVSFTAFLRAFRSPSRPRLAAYAAASAFSLYLHPWMFLVYAGQVVSAWAFRSRSAGYRRVLLAQAAALAAALPNVAVTLYQGSLDVNSWMDPPTLGTLAESLGYLTYGNTAVYAGVSALALAAVIWAGQSSIVRSRRIEYLFLAVYLIFPLAAAACISQVSRAYVPGRYEMCVLPALILLTAGLWTALKRWPVLLAAAIAGLGALAYQNVLAERREIEAYRSTDKAVVQQLLERMQDGDVVIAADLSYATASYYFRRLNQGPRAVRMELIPFPAEIGRHPSWKNLRQMAARLPEYDRQARELATRLKRQTLGGRTVWVLYNSSGPVNPLLRRALSEVYVLSAEEAPPVPREPSWFDKILMFRH